MRHADVTKAIELVHSFAAKEGARRLREMAERARALEGEIDLLQREIASRSVALARLEVTFAEVTLVTERLAAK